MRPLPCFVDDWLGSSRWWKRSEGTTSLLPFSAMIVVMFSLPIAMFWGRYLIISRIAENVGARAGSGKGGGYVLAVGLLEGERPRVAFTWVNTEASVEEQTVYSDAAREGVFVLVGFEASSFLVSFS